MLFILTTEDFFNSLTDRNGNADIRENIIGEKETSL